MAVIGKDFDQLESPDELVQAIDMKLDIEFYLFGVRYNISTNGTPFIAVCPDGDGEYFKNVAELVSKYEVNGKPLKEFWKDFQIIGM